MHCAKRAAPPCVGSACCRGLPLLLCSHCTSAAAHTAPQLASASLPFCSYRNKYIGAYSKEGTQIGCGEWGGGPALLDLFSCLTCRYSCMLAQHGRACKHTRS